MKLRQEKEFKCQECGETFDTQEDLEAHERVCAGEESEADESVDDLGETEGQSKRGKRERMY